MLIPFYLQYFVENERNDKYQWLTYGINVLAYTLYGIIFHWIPIYLRSKREKGCMKYKRYFRMIGLWELANTAFRFEFPYFGCFYIQPSLLLLYSAFLAINGTFSILETKDLDYQPQLYIVAKRISKVSLSNLPLIYITVIKNDLVTSITGLKHDKLTLLHKWHARTMFVMIVIHIVLAGKYWLDLGFPVMLVIPPQIFGYIAFASFFFLCFSSLRCLRRLAYDFFLVQHRVFSFMMLLFSFFHSMKNSKTAVILAVHQLVIDRIVSRIISVIHSRTSPTRGVSTFEILDEQTLLVTLKIKAFPFRERAWWQVALPKLNTWKAGQHVYLTVGKVSRFQGHPFTIASLSETGEMKFVIRVQKGFTKKLMKKVMEVQKNQEEELSTFPSSSSINVETELLPATARPTNDLELNQDLPTMKATFFGPYGAKYEPLITFDSVVLFSAGSGASFTLPVCVDLIKTIKYRTAHNDFVNRNPNPTIKLVITIKKLANLYWYSFILEEVIGYCNEGLMTLDVYVTQPKKDNEKYENFAASENFAAKSSENFATKDVEVSTNTSLNESILDRTNVSVYWYRPDTDKIILSGVNSLRSSQVLRSLAVLSCGPENFTHGIKRNCNKYRWSNDAPDIYCYTESFG